MGCRALATRKSTRARWVDPPNELSTYQTQHLGVRCTGDPAQWRKVQRNIIHVMVFYCFLGPQERKTVSDQNKVHALINTHLPFSWLIYRPFLSWCKHFQSKQYHITNTFACSPF